MQWEQSYYHVSAGCSFLLSWFSLVNMSYFIERSTVDGRFIFLQFLAVINNTAEYLLGIFVYTFHLFELNESWIPSHM